MEKKHTSVSDGIKAASDTIQAIEMFAAAQGMTRSKWDQFIYDLKEKILFGCAIAVLCGIWFVLGFVRW